MSAFQSPLGQQILGYAGNQALEMGKHYFGGYLPKTGIARGGRPYTRLGPSTRPRTFHSDFSGMQTPRYAREGGLVRGLPYAINRGKVVTYKKYANMQANQYNLNTTDFTNGIVELSLFDADNINIAEGSGTGSRDGRAINVATLQLRANIYLSSSGTTTTGRRWATNLVRLLVVIDSQANGGQALIEEVLDFENTTTPHERFGAYSNLKQGGRFKILHDRNYKLDSNTESNTIGIQGAMKSPKLFFKMDMPVCYSGSTGSRTLVTSNQISVFMIPLELTDSNDQYPVVELSARVRYTE